MTSTHELSANELYAIALTWTDGDEDRAALLVSSYLRGTVDRAVLKGAKP